MAQVVLSQQARFDLLSILEQLSDVAGPRTARAYDNDFKQTIENLSTFPGTGLLVLISGPRPESPASSRT